MATKAKAATKRKAASVWPHKCFTQANRLLEQYNTQLVMPFAFNFTAGTSHSEPRFATEKIDSKKRTQVKSLMFTYCPICGKKLR